jgi:hypothetical protein
MKTTKIMTTAILCLMISATLVLAAHTSSVTVSPNTWAKSTEKFVTVAVTNNGGDNIVRIELVLPKDSNQNPLYVVNMDGITTPQGWTYTARGTPINTVTWIANSSGIASGSSLNLFGIDAKSPSASGNYQWKWTTTDSKDGTNSGTVTTTVGQAPLSYLTISNVPSTSVAGNVFKITVRAYGDDNLVKTDYTGTISFSSTDAKAVLPVDYTFQPSDAGTKVFSVAYDSSGNQSLTVKDSTAGISKISTITLVKPGSAVDIAINPADKAVYTGEKVEYKVLAKDSFGNSFDVTSKATITIDKKAGGNWNKSVFTAEKEGVWVVIASYSSLIVGTTLAVGKGTAPAETPTQPINITPTVPEKTADVTLSVPETLTIAPGSNDTMIITVNNNGDKDLTGVEIKAEGVPSDWVNVYPVANDVPAKGSKDYLIIVIVPANETEPKTIEFIASSDQGLTATKSTSLVISSAPTSMFTFPKNVLQLGIVIIAVAAVVIIGWELWFKKPKSK